MSHQVEVRFTNGSKLIFSGVCLVPDDVTEHELSNLRMDLRRMESYATTGGRRLSLNVAVITPPPPPPPPQDEPAQEEEPASPQKAGTKKPAAKKAPAKKKSAKKPPAKKAAKKSDKQGELGL